MKLYFASVAAFVLLSLPASAGDFGSLKDGTAVIPVPTWGGCYFGTDGGYKWGRNRPNTPTTYSLNDRARTVVAPTGNSFETGHTDGGLWGAQGGCNYQLKPGIVIGIEASGTLDWAKDTFTTELVTAAARTHVTNVTTEIERKCQVHVGPRIGATLPGLTGNGETLTLAPLFYATGGYAGTCYRAKQSGDDPNFRRLVTNPDVSESDFISGWFVGAGVDIPTSSLVPGTFVQIEFSHAEYGDMTFRLAGSDTTGRLDNNANEIRIGFKYRFPDPTPTPLPVPR